MSDSDICVHCGSSKPELSTEEIGALILKTSMWIWEEYSEGTKALVEGLGQVEVVYNSYLSCDESSNVKLVWKTRLGHFAVEGYFSSYSGTDWSRNVKPAEQKTKEVIYFE